MIIQVDKVKTNEKDLMTLLSSPEAQKNMVDRVLSARRKREEEAPGKEKTAHFNLGKCRKLTQSLFVVVLYFPRGHATLTKAES